MKTVILKKFLKLGAMLLLPILVFSGCNKQSKSLTPLESRGKGVYVSNCTACHNLDPRLAGSVGPDIAGSSLELIKARVLHQTYPPNYKPKRSSALMPALPFLDKDIEALHAYLNTFNKQ